MWVVCGVWSDMLILSGCGCGCECECGVTDCSCLAVRPARYERDKRDLYFPAVFNLFILN